MSDKINIIHIITSLTSGGAEGMLTRLVCQNSNKNIRNTVICLTDKGIHGKTLKRNGIEVLTLDLKNFKNIFSSVNNLRKTLKCENPDIIVSWLYHADLISIIFGKFIWARKSSYFWNIRCSDIDLGNYSFITRVVLYINRCLSHLPNGIITNSFAGRDFHKSFGYKNRNWVYIPNGIDTDKWYPDAQDRNQVRTNLNIRESEIAICCVARSDPQKDHKTLLDAFTRAHRIKHNLRLFLIGRHTENIAVPEELSAHVTLLGERSDTPLLLRGMDMSILSSAYGEGFPNVIGEALATGTYCIASDVGDSARLLEKLGSIVPKEDPETMARAIIYASEKDDLRHDTAINERRSYILKNYTMDKIQSSYLALYESVQHG
jgi:glycosyltransferase involved in cell wall biosynthesis